MSKKLIIYDVKRRSNERLREARWTYCWWDSSSGGKQEPINALMKGIHINELKELGSKRAHLFPKEMGQTKSATTVTAQAMQANKHDKE